MIRFLLLSTLFSIGFTALAQNKADLSLNLIANTDTVCPGGQVLVSANILNGTPPFEFKKMNGDIVSPPFFVFPDSSYILKLNLTDATGTIVTDDVKINVYKRPEVSIKSDIINGCQPLIVTFNDEISDDINKTYLWNFGDDGISQQKNPIYTYQKDGIFNVTLLVKETHGNKTCVNTDTLKNTIEVYKKPTSKFQPSPEVAKDIKAEIYFNNYSDYAIDALWSFDDGDTSNLIAPYHTFDTIGEYKVKLIAISEYGCRDTSEKIIKIIENFSFYAPDAFTPDGDGINDEFYFTHSGIIDDGYMFEVYDRYGHVIFSTNDKNQKWNGEVYNNKIAKPGLYIYIVKYKSYMNVEYTKSGKIMVIY